MKLSLLNAVSRWSLLTSKESGSGIREAKLHDDDEDKASEDGQQLLERV